MRAFAALYEDLDASTSTAAKVAALARHFRAAAAADAAWAVYFPAGGKPRQVVPTALLRATACEAAGIDEWLFEECYQAVGDLAETMAHVLSPAMPGPDAGLAHWVEQRLLPLKGRRASVYTDYTVAVWSRAPADAAEAQAVVEADTLGVLRDLLDG
jgi:DNA ligase-1